MSSRARALLLALRPHQWAKNILLLVPALVGHRYQDLQVLQAVAVAFLAFSVSASAVYVLNDLVDLEADRQHRTKRNRPFASGALSVGFGRLLAPVLLGAGLGLGSLVSMEFLAILVGYMVITTLYTFFLKRKLLVDVLTLAGLFTYRILAGGVAAEIQVSFWLFGFAIFIFTGLAFAKRFSELIVVKDDGQGRLPGRAYEVTDLEIIQSVGPGCGLVAVLVFGLYINSQEVREIYTWPEALWPVAMVILYWFVRIWFLARRGFLHDDPVVFALRDRNSLLAGVVVACCILVARYAAP